MKTAQQIKLEDAIQNQEKYIHSMSRWNDKKLIKHLNLYRIQKEMALQQEKLDAYKLLSIYEDQVIMARLKKFQ
jgi:hypothetical protein